MKKRVQYLICINGTLVEVTPDIYQAYYHGKRQEKAQEEKKLRNGVLSYDALDREGISGASLFSDKTLPSMDEYMIEQEQKENLTKAIAVLPSWDQALIHALYYDNITAEDYAKAIGLSTSGVNHRRRKILKKLKALMNALDSSD